MSKKNICIILSIIMVMSFLTGFSTSAASKSNSKQLTVLVESGSPGELVAKKTAAAFESKTGCKVIVDAVPYTGIYDKVSTELKSGNPVHDIATLDVLWLPAFKNGLLTLNNIATSQMKSDFLPTMLTGGTLDGSLYGMPMWINAKVLIYRKDLFADKANKAAFKTQYGYNLAPPKTWQQYKDVAKFFTKNGMYGTAVYGAAGGDTVCSWLDFSAQAGAKPLVLGSDNKVLVDQKSYVDALQFMCDLFKSKSVPPETLSMASTEVQQMFVNKKIAMELNWSHQYPAAYDALPGKVAVAPMIGGKAGVGATTGPWYECVLKKSANIELAKQYVTFMYEHNGDYMEAALRIAGRKSVYNKYAQKPGNEHLKAVLDTLKMPQSQNRPATSHWTEIEDALSSAIQNAMTGKATPQAALTEARKQIEEILN